MLNEKQLKEIRGHLENAKNPIFFFDNDCDGLSSFLILQRFIGHGRGVSLKGLPSLNKTYYKKAEDFNSDYIFVLDRPGVDKEVIELNKKGRNIPIVCIDHHPTDVIPDIAGYYNTKVESDKTESTAYICYNVTKRKEDLWLAVIGCIADWFMPDFFEDFKKNYPELVRGSYKTASDIYYKTELGKIILILNLALKDTTTNAVSLYKFLMNASSPMQILEENSKTKIFLDRYELLNKIVRKNIDKAEESLDKKNKFLFFTYGGDMSLSQDIANELTYKHPEAIIAVGFIKGGHVKFSLRGVNVKSLATLAIQGIDGALIGGHEFSCGTQMSAEDIEKFKENLLNQIRKKD